MLEEVQSYVRTIIQDELLFEGYIMFKREDCLKRCIYYFRHSSHTYLWIVIICTQNKVCVAMLCVRSSSSDLRIIGSCTHITQNMNLSLYSF